MRILCDENITTKVVEILKKSNNDVETVISLGIGGISNSLLLQKASELNRVLITFDHDFLKSPLKKHPGILIISINPNTDTFVLPAIKKMIPKLENLDIMNHIMILDSTSIRYFKSQ